MNEITYLQPNTETGIYSVPTSSGEVALYANPAISENHFIQEVGDTLTKSARVQSALAESKALHAENPRGTGSNDFNGHTLPLALSIAKSYDAIFSPSPLPSSENPYDFTYSYTDTKGITRETRYSKEDMVIIALLHDSAEDGGKTIQDQMRIIADIRSKYGDHIADGINRLTVPKVEKEFKSKVKHERIAAISEGNIDAGLKVFKLLDRARNLTDDIYSLLNVEECRYEKIGTYLTETYNSFSTLREQVPESLQHIFDSVVSNLENQFIRSAATRVPLQPRLEDGHPTSPYKTIIMILSLLKKTPSHLSTTANA